MNTDVFQELTSDGYSKLCEVPYYVESRSYVEYDGTATLWYNPVTKLFAISSACPLGSRKDEYIYCSDDRLKVCLSEFKADLGCEDTIRSYGFTIDPVKEADKYLKLNYNVGRKTKKKPKICSWLPVDDLDDYADIKEFTIDVMLEDVERVFNNDGRALTLDPDDPKDADLIGTATDIVIEGASKQKSKDEVIKDLVDHLYDFTYSISN